MMLEIKKTPSLIVSVAEYCFIHTHRRAYYTSILLPQEVDSGLSRTSPTS